MSPLSLGGSNPNEPPLARKFAHSYLWASLGLAVWGVATAGPWWNAVYEALPWWGYALIGLPWAATLLWFVVALACFVQHPMAVCVRCLTDIPTDGAVQAVRLHRRLRMAHLVEDRSFRRWNNGVLVAALLAGLPRWGPLPWISAAALVGWWSVSAFSAVSEKTHLRLAPWCPYCKGGGDDEDITVSDPLPDTTGEKVRT